MASNRSHSGQPKCSFVIKFNTNPPTTYGLSGSTLRHYILLTNYPPAGNVHPNMHHTGAITIYFLCKFLIPIKNKNDKHFCHCCWKVGKICHLNRQSGFGGGERISVLPSPPQSYVKDAGDAAPFNNSNNVSDGSYHRLRGAYFGFPANSGALTMPSIPANVLLCRNGRHGGFILDLPIW